MAKKIDAALAKQLKALNINAKTEEEARKKLLEILEKEGVEGMDDEDTETLIEMADSFINDSEEEEEETAEEEETEEEEESEEEEAEELANEAEEEEETEEEEDDDDDSEDEEETEEEEEEKPAKKSAKKAPAAKTDKKAEKKPAKEEKKATKKVSKRGTKLDLKNNEDDRKELSKLKKMFGEGYNFAWLSGSGLTVKHVGKNGNRGIFTIDNATKLENGSIRCNLYLLTMTKETEKLTDMGIDWEKCWTGAPCMKGISLDEVIEILEKVYDTITAFATTVDKRLGENRKKMEESLNNSGKKKTEAKAKKADEVEEEAEEEEKPAKKSSKPAAKKVVKKSKK